MGACQSFSNSAEGERKRKLLKRESLIEKMMAQSKQEEDSKIKLLLLGAGESGKSTIFKQMRVLYGAALSVEEKQVITPIVYTNTISSMKILVNETFTMGFDREFDQENINHVDRMKLIDENAEINVEIGAAIKALWKDPGILHTWEHRAQFQIVESVKYYFNEIDRIMQPDYVASQQDMLLSRIRTSGIVTERYVIDGSNFEMYDVGGQRNERKKWIHCFDDVTAVIFVAALSEYDQVLFEDSSANRMTEAVDLFADICNNRCFESSNMILFLNKKDLYADKILRIGIGEQEAFSDFPLKVGDENYYDTGVKYFLDKFLETNQNPDRDIYNHVTCATDTENVGVVFNACKSIILRGGMAASGLL